MILLFFTNRRLKFLSAQGYKFKHSLRQRWHCIKPKFFGLKFELAVWRDEHVWLIEEGALEGQWINSRQVLGLYRSLKKFIATGEV